MNKLLTALVASMSLSAACAGERDAPAMPVAPTATAEPALVGPVLVYTEVTPLDERRVDIDMFVVAYDAGAKREIRRTTLSAFT